MATSPAGQVGMASADRDSKGGQSMSPRPPLLGLLQQLPTSAPRVNTSGSKETSVACRS